MKIKSSDLNAPMSIIQILIIIALGSASLLRASTSEDVAKKTIITVNFKNTPVGQALRTAGKLTGIRVHYTPGRGHEEAISLSLKNASGVEVFYYLTKSANLTLSYKDDGVYVTPAPKDIPTSAATMYYFPMHLGNEPYYLGLPSVPKGCEVRVFAIKKDQFKDAPFTKTDWCEYLQSCGMQFPKGGFAAFFPQTLTLIIANTPGQLDLMQPIGI